MVTLNAIWYLIEEGSRTSVELQITIKVLKTAKVLVQQKLSLRLKDSATVNPLHQYFMRSNRDSIALVLKASKGRKVIDIIY